MDGIKRERETKLQANAKRDERERERGRDWGGGGSLGSHFPQKSQTRSFVTLVIEETAVYGLDYLAHTHADHPPYIFVLLVLVVGRTQIHCPCFCPVRKIRP